MIDLGPLVLVVEDEPEIVSSSVLSLTSHGYRVL